MRNFVQLWLCVMAKGSVGDGGWRVLEGRGDEGMGRGRLSQKKMKKNQKTEEQGLCFDTRSGCV